MREREPRHCDDYIHDFSQPACLRWFLFVERLPAIDKALCHQMGAKPKLYATWQGWRVKVTMASRFGDVGIRFKWGKGFPEYGYDKRVPLEELSDFTD